MCPASLCPSVEASDVLGLSTTVKLIIGVRHRDKAYQQRGQGLPIRCRPGFDKRQASDARRSSRRQVPPREDKSFGLKQKHFICDARKGQPETWEGCSSNKWTWRRIRG